MAGWDWTVPAFGHKIDMLKLLGNVLYTHTGAAEHGGVLEGDRRLHGRDQSKGRGRQGKLSDKKGISQKPLFCRLLVQEEGCLRVDSPWLEG